MIGRIVSGVLVVLAALLVLSSCGTIETGHVGVRTTLGKVDTQELEPGLHFRLPGISRVQQFSANEIAIDLNDLTPKARDNFRCATSHHRVLQRRAGQRCRPCT